MATSTAFWALVDALESEAKELSLGKSKDYATDDVLSNFKRMAITVGSLQRTHIAPWEEAAHLLILKLDRLKNLEGRDPENESVRDTCLDIINYTRLLVGCYLEGEGDGRAQ